MWTLLRNGLVRPCDWMLRIVGLVTLAWSAAVAVPVMRPPTLASIDAGAMAIDRGSLPELSRFQARDGTWLGYRLYAAADGARTKLAILVHGSSASSSEMNAIGKALASAGIAAVAVDIRGHGSSGSRGDIAYVGQLEDDLADLVARLRRDYPQAQLSLVGHSIGGGFALRVASEASGEAFDRFVLLAPYLGYSAPSNRKNEGSALWAKPDMPRIFALAMSRRLGLHWCEDWPVIAFAVAPRSEAYVTASYSFRLLSNFGPPSDWRTALAAARKPIALIAGEADELMDSGRYPQAVQGFESKAGVSLLPGVDHMGIVRDPAALAAIVATIKS